MASSGNVAPNRIDRSHKLAEPDVFSSLKHGYARGFEAMGRLVEQCDCFRFNYGRLEDAAEAFERLASTGTP